MCYRPQAGFESNRELIGKETLSQMREGLETTQNHTEMELAAGGRQGSLSLQVSRRGWLADCPPRPEGSVH